MFCFVVGLGPFDGRPIIIKLCTTTCTVWRNYSSNALTKKLNMTIYLCNILGFVRLRRSSFPSIRPVIRRHLSLHPSKAKRGRARALLKLQNSTVSGNCPFCPIYSTIGIHPVMKGYWPIIKISGRHWGRLGMQSVQPIFSFFWVLGRGGKGRNFFFFQLGVGVPSSIHGMEETIMWQFIS